MPISKVQVPSLTTPIDIRNGHSANVTYENEQFSAQVNTVNNPYVGLILSLYFPAVLDVESGAKEVSLTFGNSETYTTSFLILGYSYEYVVPVLIQIKSINNGALTYDILHKGSVTSSSASIDVGIDSQDDTQLNFAARNNAQSTIVITYPNEDIEGTSYEVYAGGNNECLVPPYSTSDIGKVLTVGEESGGTASLEWKAAEGDGGGGESGVQMLELITQDNAPLPPEGVTPIDYKLSVVDYDESVVTGDVYCLSGGRPAYIPSFIKGRKGIGPAYVISGNASPVTTDVNNNYGLTIKSEMSVLFISDNSGL